MNFSKLFLMMALGVSLNNGAYGMEHEDNKRTRNNEVSESNKKGKQDEEPKYSKFSSEALLEAVSTKNCEIERVELLLKPDGEGFCADVNVKSKYGRTPLHCAASNGNTKCLQFLIDNGADLNAKDNNSRTPLHWAALNANAACVQILINNRAKISPNDNTNWTPLHWAARNGNIACLQLFVENGADLSAQTTDGQTALHFAAMYSNTACVQLLITHGADLCAQDNDGWTPLHGAANNDNQEIVTLILESMKAFVNELSRKQFAYFAFKNKKFNQESLTYLLCLKRNPLELEIPPNEINSKILSFVCPSLPSLNDLVNAIDNEGKTACDLGNQAVKTVIENFKKENGIN